MEKTELLAKLRELKEKILHFDNLSDEIKGTEGIIDHIRSEIKSETKEANKTMPPIVPNELCDSPEKGDIELKNLYAYDSEHKPKQSLFSKICFLIPLSICIALTLFIFRAAGIYIADYGIVVYILGFCIILALVCGTVGLIPFGIFFAIVDSNEAKADKRKVKRHLRKHEPERQAAYQKDIDIHNAKARAHRGNAESLKRDLNDYNNKLASLKSSLAEAASVVSSDTTLPNVYKDQEIVDTLIGYLEKLRADSLKEAINLYEYESKMDAHNSSMQRAAWASANHSWQQAEASRRMAAEAERQTEAAEEAAREARRAREANEQARDILKEWDRDYSRYN